MIQYLRLILQSQLRFVVFDQKSMKKKKYSFNKVAKNLVSQEIKAINICNAMIFRQIMVVNY